MHICIQVIVYCVQYVVPYMNVQKFPNQQLMT